MSVNRAVTLIASQMLTIVLMAYPFVQVAAADSPLKAGIHLYETRQYPAALAAFKKVPAGPQHVTAMYYEGLCQQQLGHRDQGDALLREIINKYPTSPEAAPANDYFIAKASNAELASIQRSTTTVSTARPSGSSSGRGYSSPNSCVVPFRRGNAGHLYVRISLNGRPQEVIFDTGAEACIISKTQLQTAGIAYQPTGNFTQIQGVGSAALTAEVVMLDTGLGDIVKNCPFYVVSNYNIDPLLGQSFFRQYQYQIDGAAGVIRFTKPGSSASAGGYDSIDIPYTDMGNEMVVKARVNGQECPMFFDTGAFTNLFPFKVWTALGQSIPSNAVPVQTGGVGGNAPGFKFRVDRLELGAISKSGVEVVVAQSGIPYPLLGQAFFKDRQFTIDQARHVIRFVH